jgi:RNA polymerase sigma-70 factor (ECF subfamily)
VRRTFDSELEALKAGDEAAFEALMNRYGGPMLRIATSYVRDREAAEDVVQETWLTFLRSLGKFEGRSSLKTWLFGILMNVARARRRKDARLLPFTTLFSRDSADARVPAVDPDRFDAEGHWVRPPESWSQLPEERLLGRETLEHVQAAVAALPAKLRDVILLRDVAGCGSDEVCRLLDISPANQRVRLHRARAAVRQTLEDYLK